MQPCSQHFVAGCATFGTFGASLVVMEEDQHRSDALWSVIPAETAHSYGVVAFNGNVVVRVDPAGNAYRYELP